MKKSELIILLVTKNFEKDDEILMLNRRIKVLVADIERLENECGQLTNACEQHLKANERLIDKGAMSEEIEKAYRDKYKNLLEKHNALNAEHDNLVKAYNDTVGVVNVIQGEIVAPSVKPVIDVDTDDFFS